MANLTVSRIANLVGISPSTVRFWLDEERSPGMYLARFFSDEAKPEPGETRRFTEEDLQTYITIKTLSDSGVSFPEIAERLEAGEIAEPLPEAEPESQSLEPVSAPESRSPENLPARAADVAVINTIRGVLERIETRTIKAEDKRIEAERLAAANEAKLGVLEQAVERTRGELNDLREKYEAERVARERLEATLETERAGRERIDSDLGVRDQTIAELREELTQLREKLEAERSARERVEFELENCKKGTIGRIFGR